VTQTANKRFHRNIPPLNSDLHFRSFQKTGNPKGTAR